MPVIFFFYVGQYVYDVNDWLLIMGLVDQPMDLTPFKCDINELIDEFSENGLTTLADMKRLWLSRKFTFIYEAKPSSKLGFFMQSLYCFCISCMSSSGTLSQRLGALYCLYCLYETQPFKPPFRIYISLGELSKLRHLVVEAKQNGIGVVPVLVKRMLEKHMFLFGSIDMNVNSATERSDEISKLQNSHIQFAYKTLFANTRIDECLRMDLGADLDLKELKKMSTEYAHAKELAIREAEAVVGIDDVRHIAEKKILVGDGLEKISEEWEAQKKEFHQLTGERPSTEAGTDKLDRELEPLLENR